MARFLDELRRRLREGGDVEAQPEEVRDSKQETRRAVAGVMREAAQARRTLRQVVLDTGDEAGQMFDQRERR